MWRLWHYLFGWHFFHAENSATEVIRRLRFTASGEPYGVYFNDNIIWVNRPGTWTITPLTYKPSE